MHFRPYSLLVAAVPLLALLRPAGAATVFSDDFSNPGPGPDAWTAVNRSGPAGDHGWGYGPMVSVLRSRQGDTNFAVTNFEAAGAGPNATASDWLISRPVPLANGQELTFDANSVDSGGFADRLQVWLNPSDTTDVGATATSTGDFSVLLLDINPAYAVLPDPGAFPVDWTTFSVTINGLAAPTTGRLAFRYFVEDSGPDGSRGGEIAVDNVRLGTTIEVNIPEPGAGLVIAAAAASLAARRSRPAGRRGRWS